MSNNNQFSGLPMPVFTAFGWAGEETAINFALSQLEAFIHALHASLPKSVQMLLPHAGLSKENQNVFLAAHENVEEDLHIAFNARPMSLELQVGLADKTVLAKTLKQMQAQPMISHRLITQLGADWALRIQQMEYDPDSSAATHYQDLFKDNVTAFGEETAVELIEKCAYLNGEEKWVTPIYVSRRYASEQAAAMGAAILEVIGEQIIEIMPLLKMLSGQKSSKASGKGSSGKRPSTRAKADESKPQAAGKDEIAETIMATSDVEDAFSYVAELQPLHLRRGFVNMTSKHWPFFSINSRTEIRPITVYYDGIYDKDSSVWRLQPNNIARLVLSPAVHRWLEDHFDEGDQILVVARKMNEDEIQISLKPVE